MAFRVKAIHAGRKGSNRVRCDSSDAILQAVLYRHRPESTHYRPTRVLIEFPVSRVFLP